MGRPGPPMCTISSRLTWCGKPPHLLHPASLSSAFRCGLRAERTAWWEPGGQRERAARRHTAGQERGAVPGSRLAPGPEAQCLPAPQLPPDHTSPNSHVETHGQVICEGQKNQCVHFKYVSVYLPAPYSQDLQMETVEKWNQSICKRLSANPPTWSNYTQFPSPHNKSNSKQPAIQKVVTVLETDTLTMKYLQEQAAAALHAAGSTALPKGTRQLRAHRLPAALKGSWFSRDLAVDTSPTLGKRDFEGLIPNGRPRLGA